MARVAVLSLLLVVGCAGDAPEPRWTVPQAESITTVRSLPVRVLSCDGLGAPEGGEYGRFDCVGGTRAPWERYDTIAVYYVLRPLAEFEGPRSRHRLMRVRFVGGPGIP